MSPQSGLFDEELQAVRNELQEREEAMRRARQERFEANKATLLAETAAWKGGGFSERIERLLGQLAHAGEPAKDMHDAILCGINSAAKAGRLTEQHVAFVEGKARIEAARVSALGTVKPTAWPHRTATDLKALDPSIGQLPEAIQQAGLEKINTFGHQLAQRGYMTELEVNASSPADACQVAGHLREVHQAMMLLAANRYRHAKGYKHANPERLAQMEQYASQVLGIDTTEHPGVNMDLPLTSDGLRQRAVRRANKESSAREKSPARAALASGLYVGKVTALTDDVLEQKVGRDPGDVVAHDRRAFGGEEVAIGQIVTISYEMGMGRVSSHSIGKSGMER